jgi:dihydroorotate dehydrogenase electron transfer subunit
MGAEKGTTRGRVLANRPVARDHVELIVDAPELSVAMPGQFAHVKTPGTLRRPISFSRLDRESGQIGLLLQVVGSGTAWLAERQPGTFLDLLGPLGRGFLPPEPDRPWCVVGGGVGIPPLYAALQTWLAQMRAPVKAILGARSADLVVMADDFANLLAEPPTVTTDDGSQGVVGTVLGPLARWRARYPDGQVYACGPTPMLSSVAQVMQGGGPVYLALEQRMGCGVGACLACVVLAHGPHGPEWKRVCHDGPVFGSEELIWS